MLPEIRFKTIPHKKQRYSTVGDYLDRNGIIEFRVSDVRNSDYEFLVLIHETIEWYLCRRAGIPLKDIDQFDIRYEKDRLKGKHTKESEPGNHPDAPYSFAHKFATKMERLLAKKLGVRWDIYDIALSALYDNP